MRFKHFKSEPLDKFFYSVSKVVVLVPAFILILAVIIKFSETVATIPQVKKNITPTPISVLKKNFDLKGPYVCVYKNKNLSLNAYVKNGNAVATVVQKGVTKKYLLKGDCVTVDGNKTCGMSPYISMAAGFLSSNTNMTMINLVASQKIGGDIDIKAVLDSCRKEDFDEKIFNLK